ncbi:MAG: hypothetical protein AAGN35_12175 [Bacteroidota bacterium]
MKNTILILLILPGLFGCSVPPKSSSGEENEENPTEVFNTPPLGETTDLAAGYSIYLPSGYVGQKSWPVIYFLDAHARGRLPLEKYAPLAEAQGFVLAGSKRSKNGQLPAQNMQAARDMIQDVQNKFSIDARRMYIAGFSGGARVAAAVAQERVDIAGVIACGAGYKPRPGDKFTFAGLAGMKDFNYQEFRQLDRSLEESGVVHLVEYFPGEHDWAPVSVMAKALQWQQFRGMATSALPRNDTAIDNMLVRVRYQDEKLKADGTAFQRWLLRKRIINYLDGLTDLSDLIAEREELRNHPETQAELSRQEDEFQREIKMQREYGRALQTEDLGYWTRVADMLHKMARNGDRFDAWLNQRVLNYLSLNAYLIGSRSLQSGNGEAAERMLAIYALVDPENSEHAYLTAALRVKQNRPEEALDALRLAVELGFADLPRLQSDPQLRPLQGNPDYPAIEAEVAKNRE